MGGDYDFGGDGGDLNLNLNRPPPLQRRTDDVLNETQLPEVYSNERTLLDWMTRSRSEGIRCINNTEPLCFYPSLPLFLSSIHHGTCRWRISLQKTHKSAASKREAAKRVTRYILRINKSLPNTDICTKLIVSNIYSSFSFFLVFVNRCRLMWNFNCLRPTCASVLQIRYVVRRNANRCFFSNSSSTVFYHPVCPIQSDIVRPQRRPHTVC